MAIHKLAEGPITLTVARVEAQVGNFGPQFAFYGEDDELVYVSEKSTLGQLGRLNLTPESVVGHSIRVEQVKKDGKTFTNIYKVGAGDVSAPSVVAPVAAPVPKLTLPELAGIYSDCVSFAMATLGAKCEAAEIPFTASDLAAAAATLFIRGTR
jgi:hypothetical protein